MAVPNTDLKQAIVRVLDKLSTEQIAEVLDFALFLQQREEGRGQKQGRLEVKTLPASQLDPLVGIVAWGGDAVEDTERLWSDD